MAGEKSTPDKAKLSAAEKSTPDKSKLTARDLEVAAKVWLCFKEQPQIDWAKLAEVAGYKNEASARVCWRAVRAKLLANGGSDMGSIAAPPSGSGSKRKAGTRFSFYSPAGSVAAAASSPTGVARFSPTVAGVGVKTDAGGDFEDDDADGEADGDEGFNSTPCKKKMRAGKGGVAGTGTGTGTGVVTATTPATRGRGGRANGKAKAKAKAKAPAPAPAPANNDAAIKQQQRERERAFEEAFPMPHFPQHHYGQDGQYDGHAAHPAQHHEQYALSFLGAPAGVHDHDVDDDDFKREFGDMVNMEPFGRRPF